MRVRQFLARSKKDLGFIWIFDFAPETTEKAYFSSEFLVQKLQFVTSEFDNFWKNDIAWTWKLEPLTHQLQANFARSHKTWIFSINGVEGLEPINLWKYGIPPSAEYNKRGYCAGTRGVN